MSDIKRFRQKRHVLGSKADIVIVAADFESVEHIFTDVWHTIAQFEARFSRFKADSELSLFNARAGEWVNISPECKDILQACQRFAQASDNIFNPFVLPALQQAGYRGSWPAVTNADPRLDVRSRHTVTLEHLELREKTAKIPADTAIDLGGIGKGYMLDILAAQLQRAGASRFYVSLGGDIVCHGFDATDQPWKIGISHASQRGKTAGIITNVRGEQLAIASSSVVRRSGHDWHHLIDPRTGKPSKGDILMATVVAYSGTAADVFAKTYVIDSTAACVSTDLDPSILAVHIQRADSSTSIPLDSRSYIS